MIESCPPTKTELAGMGMRPARLAAVYRMTLLGAIARFLGLVSQLGVIIYMFMVGLELDTTALLRRGHAAVAISHASIVAPFLLGAALALGLYPRLSTGAVPFTVFALFLGVAMSVT